MTSTISRRRLLRDGGLLWAAAAAGGGWPSRALGGPASADADSLRRWGRGLRGELILPGDEAYEPARRVWNQAVDRRPAAIARCAEVADVAKAVELARTRALPAAVRGGGHSLAGHAVCDAGIVIDLGPMHAVRVDAAERIARVEAGARWGEVIAALRPHGLGMPTAGCPDAGVAGVTLGGGESPLIAKYGAICDSVLSARVVTADGRVLRASAGENADLYFAIRGGGGNFGVVTHFEYRVHPLGDVWMGALSFPVSRAREVMLRYRDLMTGAPDELSTSVACMASAAEPTVLVLLCHCGAPSDGERLLERWRAALSPALDSVKRQLYSADFSMPSAPVAATGCFLPELHDETIAVLADHFAATPPFSTAMWNDYHGAVTRVSADEAAFPLRRPGYSLFLTAAWNAPAARAAAVGWVEAFRAALEPWSAGAYVNNLGEERAAGVRSAYGASFQRLAAIKAKYDPDNFFRLNPNVAPGGGAS